MIQTEYPFTLPVGYLVEEEGTLHREGVMRLATAADEIVPLKDPRCKPQQRGHHQPEQQRLGAPVQRQAVEQAERA